MMAFLIERVGPGVPAAHILNTLSRQRVQGQPPSGAIMQ